MNIKIDLSYKEKSEKSLKELFNDETSKFSDRVVYNVAVLTREMTKSLRAFPYLTGRLEQTEVSEQIVGSNKEYGLSAGVDYAKYMWIKGKETRWTNPSTQPQWYYSVYDKHGKEILNNAVNRAMKEV